MSSHKSVSHTLMPLLAVSSILVIAGCAARKESPASESQDLASSGDESAQSEADLGSLGQSFVSNGTGSVSLASFDGTSAPGELAAADFPANPGAAVFQPAGCVVGKNDAAAKTVTYTFNGCTGPWGLVHITGDVAVAYDSTGPTNLTLTYSSSNLRLNRASITSWKATAVITAAGDEREMRWNGSVSGTLGSGRAFARTNDKDITWSVGKACLTINGKSDGDITGRNLETTVTNYQRCLGACPAAGSDITIKNVDDGNEIELHYNGGPHATFTGVNGGTIDLTLACGL